MDLCAELQDIVGEQVEHLNNRLTHILSSCLRSPRTFFSTVLFWLQLNNQAVIENLRRVAVRTGLSRDLFELPLDPHPPLLPNVQQAQLPQGGE